MTNLLGKAYNGARKVYRFAKKVSDRLVYDLLEKKRASSRARNDGPLPWDELLPSVSQDSVSAEAAKGLPSICLVEGWLGPGGAERQFVTLATILHQRGHKVRVRVQYLEGRAGHYASYLRSLGIDVAALPRMSIAKACIKLARRGISPSIIAHMPKSQAASAISLALDLMASPVDVVHSYCDHPNIFGSWAGILSGTPVIRCSWRSGNPTGRFYFEDWMLEQYSLLARHPKVFFEANSKFAVKDYANWIGLSPERAEVIPNAFTFKCPQSSSTESIRTIRDELGIPSSVGLVLFSGRLAPEKRPFDMLEIFRLVVGRKSDVHCLVAGSDFLDCEFAQKLDGFDPDVKKRIHMLGLRTDMAELLRASQILLLTSEIESAPNAILEAMYMGLPVIATRVGGVPELVEDGVNGLLFPLGDTQGMAKAILSLLDDEPLRQKMGASGKERIKEFSIDTLYDKMRCSYLRALDVCQ